MNHGANEMNRRKRAETTDIDGRQKLEAYPHLNKRKETDNDMRDRMVHRNRNRIKMVPGQRAERGECQERQQVA